MKFSKKRSNTSAAVSSKSVSMAESTFETLSNDISNDLSNITQSKSNDSLSNYNDPSDSFSASDIGFDFEKSEKSENSQKKKKFEQLGKSISNFSLNQFDSFGTFDFDQQADQHNRDQLARQKSKKARQEAKKARGEVIIIYMFLVLV